jgi:hypothetical protein
MTCRILAALLSILLTGCGPSGPTPQIDRIELRRSGWEALDVAADRDGRGRFHRSHPLPEGRDGTFVIAPRQFELLLARLAPFQRAAVPVTAQSIAQILDARCPVGTNRVTDRGGIYVRWIGSGVDQHYFADLGCDPEHHAARNAELGAILGSFPVPPEAEAAGQVRP